MLLKGKGLLCYDCLLLLGSRSIGKLDDLLSKTRCTTTNPGRPGLGLTILGPFLTQLKLVFIRIGKHSKSKGSLIPRADGALMKHTH